MIVTVTLNVARVTLMVCFAPWAAPLSGIVKAAKISWFHLVTWYKQVCLFKNDFERLEVLLKQRYPNASKRTE